MLTSPLDVINLSFSFALGAVVAAVAIPVLIASQRRLDVGQQVYEDGPRSHESKQGTPTIGGLAFLIAAIAGFLQRPTPADLPLACLVLGAGAIGFIDDALILRKRRALGLRARTKSALLLVAALLYVSWIAHSQVGHATQVWFGRTVHLPEALWFVLAVLAINGTAHAVNLADGLDGLAAGTAVPPLLLLTYASRSAVAAVVIGACVAFLWYNRYPARIFMGDTGSLALGALLAGTAIQGYVLLILPLVGAVYVAEALSVIAQVLSFKTTGRRILKMSPLHHHFELCGWPEYRVSAAFIATSFCVAGLTWVGLLLSNGRGVAH